MEKGTCEKIIKTQKMKTDEQKSKIASRQNRLALIEQKLIRICNFVDRNFEFM